MTHADFSLIFILFIGLVILQLFAIVKISRVPAAHHRYKYFWTRVVLVFPLVGVLIYYYNVFILKKESSDFPQSYNSITDRLNRDRRKI